MSGMAHAYTYRARSAADPATGRVGLETSGGLTTTGPVEHPRFFTGFLAAAEQAATGLLAVANVAQARYYNPQLTGLRDPVVTCGGDRLRFESFSGCCGVYALALAHGLGASDRADRAAAADALVILASLIALGLFPVQRLVEPLRDVAMSGA